MANPKSGSNPASTGRLSATAIRPKSKVPKPKPLSKKAKANIHYAKRHRLT